MKEIGSIIATRDGPSSSRFSFVVTVNGSVPVRRGQFVELETEEGKMVAFVTNVIKTNRYFMRAESVREYERRGRPLTSIFPADRWEYIVADALALGMEGKEGLDRVSFPASPGGRVYEASQETLTKFLGFDQNDGVELGKLLYHGLPVKLNLTKLLRKHVAILAKSGAGKSYGASVLIEELLDRLEEQGRVASIVVDVHGEYTSFATSFESADYSDRTSIVKGKSVRIGVPNLSAYRFREFVPEMTGIQLRELGQVLEGLRAEMRSGKGPFDLDEVIDRVDGDEGIRGPTKDALLGWLFELKGLGVFGKTDYPSWEELVEPGKVVILDLSDTINLRRKQIIMTYVARNLFKLRKGGKIPPFVLFLEEAHQFCVGGDSLLLLPQNIMTIEEFVKREHANGKTSRGQIELATSPSNQRVLSLGSDLQVHHFPVKQYFKLKVPERLRLSLENGMELITTPETPLLSIDENGIKWVPASEVKKGSYLGTINSVKVEERQTYLPDLLPDETLVYFDCQFTRKLLGSLEPSYKRELGRKYYSWKKNCCVKLGFIRKLAQEKGLHFEEVMSHMHGIKMGACKGMKKIPLSLNEKFLYFVGLMASDGHLSKYNHGKWMFYELGFTNTSFALVALYRTLLKELFGVNAKIRSRVQSGSWSQVYRLTFRSKLLFLLLHRLGVHVGGGKEDDIPTEVMCALKEGVKGYIRGLFDGEGWVNDVARQVGICNKSKAFLEKLRLLLLRFGISSSLKENRDGNFELHISGGDMKKFCIEINFNHPKKKVVADKFGKTTSGFSFDSIPYPSFMKKLRRKRGLTMGEFGICSRKESGCCNITRGSLLKLTQKLEVPDDSEIASELAIAKKIVGSNVRWHRVTKIEVLGEGEVYDLTVSGGHNFIANGVVVHNCPSSESKRIAISRSVIELIAREGRKFYASLVLISQRPVRLSTTVLSQANTNIILRITNPYDLDHIKQSSECITSETAEMISTLPVGEALIVGEAVNHPIFVRIRRRRSREAAHGASLEEVARSFERNQNLDREDGKAFM